MQYTKTKRLGCFTDCNSNHIC